MGTLTINTTGAQDARIVSAFGKYLGTMDNSDPPVPRDATGAEVKATIIGKLRQIVHDQERKALIDAVTVPDLDPT